MTRIRFQNNSTLKQIDYMKFHEGDSHWRWEGGPSYPIGANEPVLPQLLSTEEMEERIKLIKLLDVLGWEVIER